MTATVTDLFCGAGGSSLGAEMAGATLVMAANHWQAAIDVHQVHFPDAAHDCADVSQVDPRRYPRTEILIASPECTNHSQARGVSRKKQGANLFDAPDPAAERSRSTMWDVVRFAEQMRYEAIIVENVVEAVKWGPDGNGALWAAWCMAMEGLGYVRRVLSLNSQNFGVDQSRDRIYVLWLLNGLVVDIELELPAWCPRCDLGVIVRQGWKPERWVGRYRQQWVWNCIECGTICEPNVGAAANIIDWSIDCPRIGDRSRPLAPKTRARILAGLDRFGWLTPIVTAGAGNTHERTPGNRARGVDEPLAVQQTTATHALAHPPAYLVRNFTARGVTGQMTTPVDEPARTVTTQTPASLLLPGFGLNTAHGGRLADLTVPHPTVCAEDDRLSLIVPLRSHMSASSTDDVVPTVTAGGNHHGLLVANNAHNLPRSTEDPVSTVTTGNRHGLLMRNNQGGAEMITPVDEPARTMTTKGHQSLLMPYYGQTECQPIDRPVPTVPTKERFALIDPDQVVDDCGFRMLEPHEIAAAMAFPVGYIPLDLHKKVQVKLAGNAVTPPVMTWIMGRVLQALEAR